MHQAFVNARDSTKVEILEAVRVGFCQPGAEVWLRKLALRLGLKSGSFDNASYFLTSDGSRIIVGSRDAFPEHGPATKFKALSDSRACFDIRWQFLVSGDSFNCLQTFVSEIARLVESGCSVEQTTSSWLSSCLDLCVAFDDFVLSNECPDDFQSRVWPSYVEALQHPSYWLDASEFVLLAFLADLNVAACLCCG